MAFFHQVGQDQPLPVQVQLIGGAGRGQPQAAAPGAGFQQQVDLGVVPQRLKVAHPLHRAGDGLPVDDVSRAEGHLRPETLLNQTGHHLQLDLAHELEVNLPQSLVPHHPQLGVLLLQLTEIAQHGMRITGGRQQYLISQHRLQLRFQGGGLNPKGIARPGPGQSGEGAHRPGGGLVYRPVFGSRVDADLVDLLLPALPLQHGTRPQRAASDL